MWLGKCCPLVPDEKWDQFRTEAFNLMLSYTRRSQLPPISMSASQQFSSTHTMSQGGRFASSSYQPPSSNFPATQSAPPSQSYGQYGHSGQQQQQSSSYATLQPVHESSGQGNTSFLGALSPPVVSSVDTSGFSSVGLGISPSTFLSDTMNMLNPGSGSGSGAQMN